MRRASSKKKRERYFCSCESKLCGGTLFRGFCLFPSGVGLETLTIRLYLVWGFLSLSSSPLGWVIEKP